jgi:hypothetical protein
MRRAIWTFALLGMFGLMLLALILSPVSALEAWLRAKAMAWSQRAAAVLDIGRRVP